MPKNIWQKENNMKKYLKPVLFAAGGALAGLLYYRFFGCSSGCPITSSPYRTMAYMGLVGLILSGLIEAPKKTR